MQFISDDGGSDKMVEKIYRFSRNKFARVHPEYRRFNNSRLTYQIFHVDLSNNGRNKKVSLSIYILSIFSSFYSLKLWIAIIRSVYTNRKTILEIFINETIILYKWLNYFHIFIILLYYLIEKIFVYSNFNPFIIIIGIQQLNQRLVHHCN